VAHTRHELLFLRISIEAERFEAKEKGLPFSSGMKLEQQLGGNEYSNHF